MLKHLSIGSNVRSVICVETAKNWIVKVMVTLKEI